MKDAAFPPDAVARLRLKLNGAVQGVGMRPFIHRLASDCRLAGFVHNGADGVTVEAAGLADVLASYQGGRRVVEVPLPPV